MGGIRRASGARRPVHQRHGHHLQRQPPGRGPLGRCRDKVERPYAGECSRFSQNLASLQAHDSVCYFSIRVIVKHTYYGEWLFGLRCHLRLQLFQQHRQSPFHVRILFFLADFVCIWIEADKANMKTAKAIEYIHHSFLFANVTAICVLQLINFQANYVCPDIKIQNWVELLQSQGGPSCSCLFQLVQGISASLR